MWGGWFVRQTWDQRAGARGRLLPAALLSAPRASLPDQQRPARTDPAARPQRDSAGRCAGGCRAAHGSANPRPGFVLFGVELDTCGAIGQQPATRRPGWSRSLEEHPQMPAPPRGFQVGGNPIGSETTTHRGQDRETVRLISVKDREAARAVLIEQVRPKSAGTAQVLTHDF